MTAFRIRDASNTERVIVEWQVRDANNTLRAIQLGQARDASNVLRPFFEPMEVAISPDALETSAGTMSWPYTVTSLPCTASATGGQGTVTYAWTLVSGDSSIAFGASGASNRFSSSFSAEATKAAVFECTATDSVGAVATAQITVTLVAVDYR